MADPNVPSTTPTNVLANIHPKVFTGTMAAALSILIVWAVHTWAKQDIPPEVASAFTTILGGLVGYITPGGTVS